MDKKIISTLKGLGMSETEIKSYLFLLQHGKITATELSEKTDLKRSTARYNLDQLVKKRLAVTEHKNNVFYFIPEQPTQIVNLLESKKVEIEQQEHALQEILAPLQGMMQSDATLSKVEFYKGVDGVKRLYADIVQKDVPIVGIISHNQTDRHLEIAQFLERVYVPKRKEFQSKSWIVIDDSLDSVAYRNLDTDMNRETMLAPKSVLPIENSFHIYDGKVAFVSAKANDLSGMIIRNDNILKTQYAIFKVLWKTLQGLPMNQDHQSSSLPEVEFFQTQRVPVSS